MVNFIKSNLDDAVLDISWQFDIRNQLRRPYKSTALSKVGVMKAFRRCLRHICAKKRGECRLQDGDSWNVCQNATRNTFASRSINHEYIPPPKLQLYPQSAQKAPMSTAETLLMNSLLISFQFPSCPNLLKSAGPPNHHTNWLRSVLKKVFCSYAETKNSEAISVLRKASTPFNTIKMSSSPLWITYVRGNYFPTYRNLTTAT